MLPIEEFKLTIYINFLSAYLWEMKILTKLFHYPLPRRIFSEKNKDIFITATTMMLIIMMITNDLTSSSSTVHRLER